MDEDDFYSEGHSDIINGKSRRLAGGYPAAASYIDRCRSDVRVEYA